jgi:hypothetical protein
MSSSDPFGELIGKLDEIGPLAGKVAELKGNTIEQEAEALVKILERIKPMLEAIAYKTPNGYYSSGQQFHKEKNSYFDERGLVLIDEFKEECTDRDTRGDFTGRRLVLFQDGRLMAFERRGDWSRWQGESSNWQAEDEEDLSPQEAVRRYGLKRIVEGLANEIKESSEGLQKKLAGYEERLAMIRKVQEGLQ